MTNLKDLKTRFLKDPEVRKEYDALEEEFALMAAMAKARLRAGLSQAQLAKRMKTTPERDRAAGKRARAAVDHGAVALCQGVGAQAEDQL